MQIALETAEVPTHPSGRRALTTMVGARGCTSAAYYAIVPFLSIWLTDVKHLSTSDASATVGLFVLTTRAGMAATAPVIRRVGERTALTGASAPSLVILLLLGRFDPASTIIWYLAFAALGLQFSAVTLALRSATSKAFAGQLLRGFSYLNLAVNAGSALGPLVAGFTIARHPGALPWIASGLVLGALVAASAAPPAAIAGTPNGRSAGGADHRVPRGSPSRGLWSFLGLSSLTWIGYALVFNVFPALATDLHGPRTVSLMFGLNAAVIVLGQVWVGTRIARRLRRSGAVGTSRLLGATNLLMALATMGLLVIYTAVWPLFLVAIAAYTVAEMAWSPMSDSLVAILADGTEPVVAYAWAGVAWGIVEGAATLVGLRVINSATVSPPGLTILAGGAVVTALAALLFASTPVARRPLAIT